MVEEAVIKRYVSGSHFRESLSLPAGTELSLTPLGQGEYNANYLFFHPVTGEKLVLRLNFGSQMHLPNQIEYEYHALLLLRTSGRTPRPLFCDGSGEELPCGVLVMEYLPGRALRYETDLRIAAEILADIHAMPLENSSGLIAPEAPARAIYAECLDMAEHYLRWEGSEAESRRLITRLIREIGKLPLDGPPPGRRCIVNTELNSGNFLINERKKSFLVDWEKPLYSEPAQDLGHFLAPTTTFWKTDTILPPEQIARFVDYYLHAMKGNPCVRGLKERLPLFFTVTCLRGVAWCSMALREYCAPGRALRNEDTFRKLAQYLDPAFLTMLLETYVLRDFLKGA